MVLAPCHIALFSEHSASRFFIALATFSNCSLTIMHGGIRETHTESISCAYFITHRSPSAPYTMEYNDPDGRPDDNG
jgi:hypothetical protein